MALPKFTDGIAVTPSDTTEYVPIVQYIFVGGNGNLQLETNGGHTVLLTGLVAPVLIPAAARKIMATNTTATLMVAFW